MEEAKKMRPREYIKIRGANEHNLKNINVDIPRNELVVNEIESDYDCEIEAVLASNEQKVEYGQPLFKVKKLED